MLVRRLAAVGLLAAATVPAPGVPASAHGSPTAPISRTAACAGNGTRRDAAACTAALKATGGFLGAYDNLRLSNVNGDDRSRVPDGKLCSGGLDAYRGLDLVRDDFPSTTVRSGQKLKISYRGTIAHRGSFRLYLTEAGFTPSKALDWDDLAELDEFTDPPLTGGAYRMRVTLPQRTGRHILYVVWETSGTPDTYYSCSDLVFTAAPAKTAVPEGAATPSPSAAAPARAGTPATAEPAGPDPAGPDPAGATAGSPAQSAAPLLAAAAGDAGDAGGTAALGRRLIGAAAAVAVLTVIAAGAGRLRRRRNSH